MSKIVLPEQRMQDAGAPAWPEFLAQIRGRRKEFERQKFISQDVVEGFRQRGIYRALVARRFGGSELSPAQFCQLIESIAHADGSAGWVASFGIGGVYLSALPLETLKALYARSVDLVFAGGIFPPRPAQRVPGGLKVSGRWSFASGCMGADVVGVGILPSSGDTQELPRMAVMDRAKARIEPNWEVAGLAGTGSHDLIVEDVVVPEEWTFVRGGKSSLDEKLYRYPALAFAAQVLSVVGLGVARAALDEVVNLARGRASVTGAPTLGDRVYVQLEMAKAEAELRAARAWFYEAIAIAWEALDHAESASDDAISMLRLSSTHATRVAAEVTRRAQMVAGMTGVYEASPIAMQVRDAQMVTQHAFMGEITYQNAGAMLFGHAPTPGYL
ncbi:MULTISPECIES: acyl-CoA dehydrogenase family protein [unclassified Xanthobacter]|uniref:acyl-CoA dehydrogenase family protein n=1 Tax=unclassified Xanthobacter TaxID=2623496 RepID=UPI001EDFB0EF|nr:MULTISPECIES: acyl-CoA dehydrogenase family protein [unclassified Xanthobacter]